LRAAVAATCHAELMIGTVALVALSFFVWSIVVIVRADKARAAGETPDPKKVRDAKALAVGSIVIFGVAIGAGVLLLPLL